MMRRLGVPATATTLVEASTPAPATPPAEVPAPMPPRMPRIGVPRPPEPTKQAGFIPPVPPRRSDPWDARAPHWVVWLPWIGDRLPPPCDFHRLVLIPATAEEVADHHALPYRTHGVGWLDDRLPPSLRERALAADAALRLQVEAMR